LLFVLESTINVLLASAALILLATSLAAMRRVPEGQAWTVHRFGRYVRTLQPGTHAVWPVLDRIARHVSLTGHHIELPTHAFGADSATADFYFQILDPMASRGGLEWVDEMVMRQADDALTSVAAQLPQQTGWTRSTNPGQATAIADALKAELNCRLARMGLRIIRCALHAS
jgi:regulator of protease activity HflC (stomatin/prohibitin superfamily)